MKKAILFSIAVCLFISSNTNADTFGTGENQLEIDFVTILGDASSANGTNISHSSIDNASRSFTDPGDFRIGKYEVTNEIWDAFLNMYGSVTGSLVNNGLGILVNPYDNDTYWTGENIPVTGVSWPEAAQFVNWLNTSSGHEAAYKFTGTQGTDDYTFSFWNATDNGYNPNNPFRNSNACYFLPTEDEWVKAAYWNGSTLQTYATINDSRPIIGVDSNYSDWPDGQPWNIGNGSGELNGTFDMMGNVWESIEGPYFNDGLANDTELVMRGGSVYENYIWTTVTQRHVQGIVGEGELSGFRVASVPEPATVSLLALGGLALLRKRK